jgi:hypothetical protein
MAEAFLLAHQLWLDVSVPAVVTTEPAGADVAFAPYRTPTTWFPLGRTPLDGVRVPRTMIRLRITKPGFQTIEGSGSPLTLRYRLDVAGEVPPGMVRVTGSNDSRSPIGSSKRSSIRADTVGATTGGNRSSNAVDPCRGTTPSRDFVTPPDGPDPRPGPPAHLPTIKRISRSAA